MSLAGALAGALTGLVLGSPLAGLVHSAPQPGPWWAPWRPTGRRWSDVTWTDRIASTAGSALGAGLAGAAAGLGAVWPAFLVVGLAAGPLAVVDVRLHRLLDRIVLPATAATVVLLALAALVDATDEPLLRAVVAAAVVAVVLGAVALLARGGFGLGDAKTAALLALPLGWISWPAVVVGLWVGFVLAALGTLVLLAARRIGWRTSVAFGPGLLLGALATAAVLGA